MSPLRPLFLPVTVLSALAGPASALSCLPWGPSDAYLEAAKSDKTYVVVEGVLSFDEGALPKAPQDNPNDAPPRSLIPAQLNGKLMTGQGFAKPVDLPITLEILCFGPWCAGAADGVDYLAFLEQRADDYVLRMDPCGGFGFGGTDGAAREEVLACHAGTSCTPWSER
ncbi:hypothetical protein PhaeoP83_00427 [Phaeobacter inhibens]|uniref:Lipoprotein n=1 Tax=Phaeobacter inhibens TaxID=221822 RepID=A0A2I7JSA0_9RHOB|nr:hypothetical protein [Phaeobacter inhibens]AUQ48742.1 hypothetical protein PhaeoP83_00427 [Phaeobacter inhibens]AUQ71662.1 hypothetical protein PhaeoP54_02805 [Phaeobacter inhibens]AUQ93242.1 hypothetical protein PhaeoP66_00420 [Phaeobacter inhibens]AUR00281.1 hypothetical protein PhaeoP88_02944 [Phaeobacter inhibens]AUR18545.1 hypothetical protein PhaeoP80_00427 [Phaeobacter inhibens]